jgi:hypothetical protein
MMRCNTGKEMMKKGGKVKSSCDMDMKGKSKAKPKPYAKGGAVKARGCGAAKKGTMARGPMA